MRGRCKTVASSYNFIQDSFAKNLSSHSIISFLGTVLDKWAIVLNLGLLAHVKRDPLKSRSSILIELRKLLKLAVVFSLIGLPQIYQNTIH